MLRLTAVFLNKIGVDSVAALFKLVVLQRVDLASSNFFAAVTTFYLDNLLADFGNDQNSYLELSAKGFCLINTATSFRNICFYHRPPLRFIMCVCLYG